MTRKISKAEHNYTKSNRSFKCPFTSRRAKLEVSRASEELLRYALRYRTGGRHDEKHTPHTNHILAGLGFSYLTDSIEQITIQR